MMQSKIIAGSTHEVENELNEFLTVTNWDRVLEICYQMTTANVSVLIIYQVEGTTDD
jgi:hypothetical protein